MVSPRAGFLPLGMLALWAWSLSLVRDSRVRCRAYSGIPGLCPLETSHPHVWQPEMSPDTATCFLGGRITHDWEHWFGSLAMDCGGTSSQMLSLPHHQQ